VALEAGAPGVDAAAVTAALVGLTESPAEGAEPVTADGRPLLFANLTYDDLQKAAAAAPEGTDLSNANALVTAATEAHAASEDPDKGEFFTTPDLISGSVPRVRGDGQRDVPRGGHREKNFGV
jgi:hypothetical protein